MYFSEGNVIPVPLIQCGCHSFPVSDPQLLLRIDMTGLVANLLLKFLLQTAGQLPLVQTPIRQAEWQGYYTDEPTSVCPGEFEARIRNMIYNSE